VTIVLTYWHHWYPYIAKITPQKKNQGIVKKKSLVCEYTVHSHLIVALSMGPPSQLVRAWTQKQVICYDNIRSPTQYSSLVWRPASLPAIPIHGITTHSSSKGKLFCCCCCCKGHKIRPKPQQEFTV
jgi:hypothetical protein